MRLDPQFAKYIESIREVAFSTGKVSRVEMSAQQIMHERRVIHVLGRLKDGQRSAKMMDRKLDVFLGQGRKAAYTLNIPEHKKIR
jgi:hypothetical protein